MRLSENQENGDRAEHAVQGDFLNIGWAWPQKILQDIGNDLITFARDRNREDLGLPVVLQVKGSRDRYAQAKSGDGPIGWWYYEPDTRHFDHWTRYGIPCLLVLHDIDSRTSYWAHVNGDAIVSTGQGRRIFVPESQQLNWDNFDSLIAVAASPRVNELEGSVWHGHRAKIPPSAFLRTALVAPRVVAPNLNRPPESVTFEQATAMLLRGHREAINRLAQKKIVPPVDTMLNERDWGWRFVGALDTLLTKGDVSAFEDLASEARHPFERTACQIIISCAAYQEEDLPAALSVLEISSEAEAVDIAWIHSQLAHVYLEMEDNTQAAHHAGLALEEISSQHGDPVATAIRGGCTAIIFALSPSPFNPTDLEAFIKAQDNAVAWWRSLQINNGIQADLKASFETWSESGSKNRIDPNHPQQPLSMARWNAALSCDWVSWRDCSHLLAMQILTTDPDNVSAEKALQILRISGHSKALERAAPRLWRGGPFAPLKTAVTRLTQNRWHRRAEGSNLRLYADAGDLLTEEDAASAINQVVRLIEEFGERRVFARSWANRWPEIRKSLNRLLTAAPISSHEQVAAFVSKHLSTTEGAAEEELVGIAAQVDIASIEPALQESLFQSSRARSDYLGIAMLEILAPHHIQAANQIRELADSGNKDAALSAVITGQARDKDWSAIAESAQRRVHLDLDQSRRHAYSLGTRESLHDLALASMRTQERSHWETVLEAIGSGTMSLDHVKKTLWLLAHRFDELPGFVQDRIYNMSGDIRTGPAFFGNTDSECLRFALQIASSSFDDEQKIVSQYHNLRHKGHGVDLSQALSIWKNDLAVSYISTMCTDKSTRVRATSTYALVRILARDSSHEPTITTVLSSAVENEQGCYLPYRLGHALADHSNVNLPKLRNMLSIHQSALVRNAPNRKV